MVDTPETLHHYTTGAGLMGIFEPRDFGGWDVPPKRSLTLWASDARYLNDAQELTYAADVLADAMCNLVDRSDSEHAEYIDEMAQRIRQGVFLDPRDDTPHTAYVTSFCERPDLLSQWRGYGANGYSIGFPSKVLEAFMTPVMQAAGAPASPYLTQIKLAPVQYTIDRSFIEVYAQKIVDDRIWALQLALECLAQFKHPSFQEEKEWRFLVSLGENLVQCPFRVSPQGMLIPYLPLRFTPYNLLAPSEEPWHLDPVATSVHVGPSPDQQLRAESVRRMLQQWSFRDVKVETSQTPFRG
ncbi:DUF2971 domain-containing protein (plasmid) [Rhodococcus pyridinivorans]|uniref:DUF2971 domain-containing protein n=1 Tax=Rhodococcus pyridinivorans TaxID=103816 RepID=UPI001C303D0B|nr:DUF2971 domain-containing protein [Rhodococcus pyridinivorans]QXF84534.1 DUF2971 domain-containing protein [Rhodococcus pyridinivorans]